MRVEPHVSILIPVHNCRPWISRAIESALGQTLPAREIIVLDDGSTDGSGDVIARYGDQIRVASCAHAGQNRSRNRLTSLSTGDWLLFLDADDELAPNAIEAKLACGIEADAIYGSMESATFDGTDKVRSSVRVAADFEDPWLAAFGWRYPNTSSFLFRRTALIRAGPWDESVQCCTDYDLYFRLLLSGARLKAAPGATSLYRHWSVNQAVHIRPMARVTAKIRLMRRAAEALGRSDAMSTIRRRAFEQATLTCIRSLYHFDRARAWSEMRSLREWNDRAAPASPEFPWLYVMAFGLGGLDAAETVARWGRGMRRAVRRRVERNAIDFDAQSMAAGRQLPPYLQPDDVRAG